MDKLELVHVGYYKIVAHLTLSGSSSQCHVRRLALTLSLSIWLQRSPHTIKYAIVNGKYECYYRDALLTIHVGFVCVYYQRAVFRSSWSYIGVVVTACIPFVS
jgi:hypothetical protein